MRALNSPPKCICKLVLIDRSYVCSGNIQIVSWKSEFTTGRYSLMLKTTTVLQKKRVLQTENIKMLEARLKISREFGAEKKVFNTFLLVE